MLQFFGRGSAFADSHNCAFFRCRDELVLLDCPMDAFQKLKHADLTSGVSRIRVLLTHTHGDHAGGIPMLIHYAFFILHIPVTVQAPSPAVREDLRLILDHLEGCDPRGYTLQDPESADPPFTAVPIPTQHVPALEGRCFGYYLSVDGQECVYTGDSCTLEPFLPYLHAGVTLYTETCWHRSAVHMHIGAFLPVLTALTEQGVRVYLMHLDDEEKIASAICGTKLCLAPLYTTRRDNMTDRNDSVLSEILTLTDKLYKQMCSGEGNDHSRLFADLTELGKVLTGADRASFWKWDKQKKELWTLSAIGTERIVIPETTGLVGKALREKRIIVTNDPYSDPDFNPAVDKKTGYVTKSVMVLPVADVNGAFIGAYQMINKPGGFDEAEDTRRLSLAALICGIALESDTFLEESQHDKLTHLKNRMGFYADYLRRYGKMLAEGKQVSMFLCDIDHFKRVNDTYGHNAGDDALVFVSGILADSCRQGDCAYRWGGEEFIMLMPDTPIEQAAKIADSIRVRIMNSVCHADGNDIQLTISFGCWEMDGSIQAEANVKRADNRLYVAKETGRNKVIWND